MPIHRYRIEYDDNYYDNLHLREVNDIKQEGDYGKSYHSYLVHASFLVLFIGNVWTTILVVITAAAAIS